jgi:hypothetical protein
LPVLNNSKVEHFARLVATGHSPAQAYAAAGYEEKTAYTCGPRLLKRPEVRSRVTELQQTVAQTSVDAVIFNRERVLNRLSQLSHEAQRKGQYSTAARCEELIGKQLGMFVDRFQNLPTRVEDLPEELLDDFIDQFAALADAQEKQKQLEAQKPAAEQTVDVKAEEPKE